MDNAGLAIVIDSQAVAIRCEKEYFARLRVEEEEERPAQEAAQTVARDMESAGLEFDEVFGCSARHFPCVIQITPVTP